MADLAMQWNQLCEEFEAARKSDMEAFHSVKGKFAAIAKNGRKNPAEEEVDHWKQTTAALDDVKARMQKFLAENT